MRRIELFCLGMIILLCPSIAPCGDVMKKEPQVPPELNFVRTVDMETFVQSAGKMHQGAQTLRIRTRYLDPDVNAFVGMYTGFSHFNEVLRLGDPSNPDTGPLIWNWGVDMGLVRHRQLWELDILGVIAAGHLGPAFALVGEHPLRTHWVFSHRTELNIFPGANNVIVDQDQQLVYHWKSFGIEVGYRLCGAQHMSNRNGPFAGVFYFFNSPKMPFIFPSIG